jgi:hypothetical protein
MDWFCMQDRVNFVSDENNREGSGDGSVVHFETTRPLGARTLIPTVTKVLTLSQQIAHIVLDSGPIHAFRCHPR